MNSSNYNNENNGSNNQLIMYQPFNFVVFLSFYSPIILASIMVSLSFIFQNFKGLVFLGFLLGVCIVRVFIYMLNGAKPLINDETICTTIQYSKYGNAAFSVFVFAFTIMYLAIPMFSNGSVNYWVLIGLISYFFFDMFIKIYKGCIKNYGNLFINVLMGMTSSAIIVILMYLGGSSKYLFFNEIQSNKQVCSMPKTQTFKCNVYKNGELIGNL
jgi:hypothetical protein